MARYNFSLREVRALATLVLIGPITVFFILPKLISMTVVSTVIAIGIWLFTCNRLARGPIAPFYGPTQLQGKTCLVTGGNTGLGRETALALAQRGADRIILACRDTKKAADAVGYITATVGPALKTRIEVRGLDLGSFESIRKLAASIAADGHPIHILVNNAGVMNSPYRLTADGFEEHIGINHLGHMLLTLELLDNLKQNKARVVTVASSGHAYRNQSRFPSVDSWLYPDRQKWIGMDRFWQYCNSKLANILFTRVLQSKFGDSGATAYWYVWLLCHINQIIGRTRF